MDSGGWARGEGKVDSKAQLQVKEDSTPTSTRKIGGGDRWILLASSGRMVHPI